ncbi:MAG: hypothetical protein JWM82_2795 [Myxococcales bacterium]|nr:hypothetical protein [Myxococcales bacterium]
MSWRPRVCVTLRARTLGVAVHRLIAWVLAPVAFVGTLAILESANVARGAEVTRIVSALDDENQFDFNVTASWLHEIKSAFIKREDVVNGATVPVKDSVYAQTRDVLGLRMDFGILWDVGLHIAAPLVLSDERSLDFDQTAAGCTFVGADATCVNQTTSTVLRDGILPGYKMPTYGLKANGDAFTDPSRTIFRGPRRSGFESLDLGITWAPFNQMRDDTRPTWTIAFESKLDVFRDMRFDPSNPGANTAVGLGYHQFVWSTFVSKRFRYFDPYFGAWYNLPVRTNGSIYQEFQGGNQTAVNPMMRAGVLAGFEQIAWENPRAQQRVTVEFRGRAEQHFFGRSASELWEPLSGSSKCAVDPTSSSGCRPGIDDGVADGTFMRHPGVTETQPYGTFGGDAGLNVQVGKYVRFRGLFGLTLDMPHFLTYAGAGVDHSAVGTPGYRRVESSDPSEANVNYRDALDSPGRRFKVEGTQLWSLFLEGSIMF